MAVYDSISAVANDPMFWAAMQSPNANYYLQNDNTRVARATIPKSVPNNSNNVAHKGGEIPEPNNSGGLLTGISIGGTLVAGALACFSAYKHKDGNGIKQAFQNAWKAFMNK